MFLQHPQQLVIVNSLINGNLVLKKKLNVCFYTAIGQIYAIRIRADEHGY